MRILLFGRYNSSYTRTLVLITGLRRMGIEITECNDHSWSFLKFISLFFKYLAAPNYDLLFIPFPGQEVVLFAWLLSLPRRLFKRTPIIFDTLTSHYEGYILDRKKYSPHSLHAAWYRFLDRISVRLSDVSLLESNAHIDFFVKEYGLPKDKFIRVFQGSDDSIVYPQAEIRDNKFIVHFHGNFVPVQGVEYIVRAAAILKNEDIQFRVVGAGQDFATCRQLAEDLGLSNILWTGKVSHAQVVKYINEADLCLGVFGSSPKAQTSISIKIFEYMACGKAIITGRADGAQEVIHDGENGVLCNLADSEDLARCIKSLKTDPDLRKRLSEHAFKDFKQEYTPDAITYHLLENLKLRGFIPV